MPLVPELVNVAVGIMLNIILLIIEGFQLMAALAFSVVLLSVTVTDVLSYPYPASCCFGANGITQ